MVFYLDDYLLFLQIVNESTVKAINVCSRVQKPESSKDVLRKLYPATTAGKGVRSKFCPIIESIAEKNKVKKKPTLKGGRPRAVLTLLLPSTANVIPKGM